MLLLPHAKERKHIFDKNRGVRLHFDEANHQIVLSCTKNNYQYSNMYYYDDINAEMGEIIFEKTIST